MARVDYSGNCQCGNVRVVFSTAVAAHELHPRCCDCDFCTARNAAWLSDANGSLQVSFSREADINRERQGAGLVDFYSCNECGELLMVAGDIQGRLCAAVNSKCLDDHERFGENVPVSPKQLSPEEKTQRWANVWIANVTIGDQISTANTGKPDA